MAICILNGELGEEGMPGLEHVANGGARWRLYFHLKWEVDRVTAESGHPNPSSHNASSVSCVSSKDLFQ